jgi:hypothetical protein
MQGMNPAILGALIGAIPGTIAASLTTWTSIRISNANQAQTTLTLTSEHAKWLREKRSEVYVDLLTHVNKAEIAWNTLSEADGEEKTEALKTSLLTLYQNRQGATDISNLAARAGSYTATSTSYTYINMVNVDTDIWFEVREEISSGNKLFKISPKLASLIDQANIYSNRLNKAAVSDLQTLPFPYAPPELQRSFLSLKAIRERFRRQ